VQPRLTPVDELAGVYARMSGLLLSEQTVSSALELITSLARDTLAGSVGSGVTLLNGDGEPTTSAATDPLVERLDQLQYFIDEGPCLTALREQSVVRSVRLADETRWPTWTRQARALGAGSVMSAGLHTDHGPLGAVKVYSHDPDAFSFEQEDLLRRFAAQAAILVRNIQTARAVARVSDELKQTLRAREIISTARGIVMARKSLNAEGAYRHLLKLSHQARLPVHELAERIVASAQPMDLPGDK
jgi:GAF domain-containing protein